MTQQTQAPQQQAAHSRLTQIEATYREERATRTDELQRLRRMRDDIDAEVADMQRTVVRIAETSAQGWRDTRIDLIDQDIRLWQRAFDQIVARIQLARAAQDQQADQQNGALVTLDHIA